MERSTYSMSVAVRIRAAGDLTWTPGVIDVIGNLSIADVESIKAAIYAVLEDHARLIVDMTADAHRG